MQTMLKCTVVAVRGFPKETARIMDEIIVASSSELLRSPAEVMFMALSLGADLGGDVVASLFEVEPSLTEGRLKVVV